MWTSPADPKCNDRSPDDIFAEIFGSMGGGAAAAACHLEAAVAAWGGMPGGMGGMFGGMGGMPGGMDSF